MASPIVRFDTVNKAYRTGKVETHVLREVTLDVEEGEFVAIVGTSGSGKSTLLNIIGGLDRDFTGKVTVVGQEINRLSDRDLSHLRNEKVGFIFQQFNLLEHVSCLENVSIPSMFSRQGSNSVQKRAMSALDKVGIADRARSLPSNLSGGQKQRVAIARALFNHPPLLLCDEPTGNLDTKTGRQIIELFTQLNREDKITLIIVTHESRVSRAAKRVLRLEDGQLGPDSGEVGVDGHRGED